MVPAFTFAGVVAACLAQRRCAKLHTVVRSDDARRFPVGAKVVCPDGGTPRAFDMTGADSQVLCNHLPQSESPDLCGVQCLQIEAGLSLELFCERLYPPLQCIVAGAGHIGVALAAIGKTLGWSMVVADDRADYASSTRFVPGVRVLCTPFEKLWDGVTVDEATAVVLVTRGHRHDESTLRSLVDRPAFYAGMIGSRRRVERVFRQLRQEQVSETWLKRLYAPVGLPVGAETPGEIALAIAAEITCAWRQRGAWAREQKEVYYRSK